MATGATTTGKVFVYRNLNRRGKVYSVRDEKTKLVIDRVESIVIKDALLKVSEAGQKRVLKDQRKNVHAGVRGERVSSLPEKIGNLRKIKFTYNPYVCPFFVNVDDKTPILEAKYVEINQYGNFAYI